MTKTESIFTYAQFVQRMTSGHGVATPDGGCPVGVALDVFRGRWKPDRRAVKYSLRHLNSHCKESMRGVCRRPVNGIRQAFLAKDGVLAYGTIRIEVRRP